MEKELQSFYFKLVIPALFVCLILFILERLHMNIFFIRASRIGTILLVLLSACLSILLPLWFRIFFIRRIKGKSHTSVRQFIRFEKHFMLIAELSLMVIPVAHLLQVPETQMLCITLFGFYAAYYYFPSVRRVHLEKKIFRVKDA